MMGLIRIFWTNLEKWQRVALIIVLQGIVILIIVTTLSSILSSTRNRIDTIDDSNQTASMPSAAKDAYEDALWGIIKTNVDGIDRSVIQGARIREDSYTEKKMNDDGVVQAGFIVDIDSIEQTYRVIVSWDKNESDVMEVVIDCPAVNESKYPDSFCQGTYRNTNDLSLYLPYIVEANENEDTKDLYIDGDEDEHAIFIEITACEEYFDELKKQAMDYLENTPLDLQKYTITYNISSLSTKCGGVY